MEACKNYNGMVVFDRAIHINGVDVLGILFNVEDERIHRATEENWTDYISYMVGVEQFIKNGGVISNDMTRWTMSDGFHSIHDNGGLLLIVSALMKGLVGFRRYEFDRPIEWQEGEIEDSEFVVGQTLIDRYTRTTDTLPDRPDCSTPKRNC